MLQYLPDEAVSIDKFVVPYFGTNGCKQFMKNKPVNFGCKFWVAATTLGYAIRFLPYMGKDENYDLTLDGSILSKLAGSLPNEYGSNYHTVMKVFGNSPLLRLLKEMGMAATRTVRINCVEKA